MQNRILVFIDWFYPAYKAGGPVKSVYNLVKGLESAFQFYLVCSNQEINGETIEVPTGQWTTFDGINVLYLKKEGLQKEQYQRILSEIRPDTIYYNSLFSINFTLKPLYLFRKSLVPQIIAPRGMFGKASLNIKPFKKKLFLSLARRFLFMSKQILWHATSKQEMKDIRSNLGDQANIYLARNLAAPILERNKENITKLEGELRLVFISRIVPIKNLYFFIELLNKVQNKFILFDIYGPIEDVDYWNLCLNLIKQNPNVKYCGELEPSQVRLKLQQYHFSVLPTKHENYGNSIVESWLSGVPVIISDQTPWKGLKEKKIGVDLALNHQSDWQETIQQISKLDQESYNAMIDACFTFAKNVLHENAVLKQNESLFQTAISRSKKLKKSS